MYCKLGYTGQTFIFTVLFTVKSFAAQRGSKKRCGSLTEKYILHQINSIKWRLEYVHMHNYQYKAYD